MGKFCVDCGNHLSFLKSLTTSICADCEKKRLLEKERVSAEKKADRDRILKEITLKKEINENQTEALKKQEKPELINFYLEVLSKFESDGEMEKNEIITLQKMKDALGLTNQEVSFEERVIPYIYAYLIKNENTLPPVHLNIGDGMSNVILKKGEEIKYVAQVSLKESRVVRVGYEGGSHGVSIRIAKGLSYRVGSHRGQIKKEEQMVETSSGYLMITNKRVLLHPFPGHKSISVPLEKIISYNCFENGIEIYKDGQEKSYFFQSLNKSFPEIAGMVLGFLFDRLQD